MTINLKPAVIAWVTCIALLMCLFALQSSVNVSASTDMGNYLSSRITSANASSTAGTRLLGPGTLGSVIIIDGSRASTTAATEFGVYDGTGTGTSSAEKIATFATTTTPGVYTFDVSIDNGLIIDVPKGFTGQYVVTYRL